MSWTGCETVAQWFRGFQATDETFRSELKRLVDALAPGLSAIASLTERYEPRLGEFIRKEFVGLPRVATLRMLHAWRGAHDAGVPFEILRERAARRIAIAKRRLVRVVIESDAARVVLRPSHVPGHYPSRSGALAGAATG